MNIDGWDTFIRLHGGIIGASFGGMMALLCVLYILLVIAQWKIFEKAGEAGWKSLIPIYNIYILYKISGIKNWFWWGILISFGTSFLSGVAGSASTAGLVISIIGGICYLIINIWLLYRLAKAFGEGLLFTIGLVFLPTIFTLILGFSSMEYKGIKE